MHQKIRVSLLGSAKPLGAVFVIALVLLSTFASWHSPQKAFAATSNSINFQARLMSASGSIAPDGFYNIEFKLYNALSGGTLQFTDTYYDSNGVTAGNDARVRVANGYLTVSLGSQGGNDHICVNDDIGKANVGIIYDMLCNINRAHKIPQEIARRPPTAGVMPLQGYCVSTLSRAGGRNERTSF